MPKMPMRIAARNRWTRGACVAFARSPHTASARPRDRRCSFGAAALSGSAEPPLETRVDRSARPGGVVRWQSPMSAVRQMHLAQERGAANRGSARRDRRSLIASRIAAAYQRPGDGDALLLAPDSIPADARAVRPNRRRCNKAQPRVRASAIGVRAMRIGISAFSSALNSGSRWWN